MIHAIKMRCAHLKNPMGIDERNPLLSWNVKDAKKQTAYEIYTQCNHSPGWTSGIVYTSAMHCIYQGVAESRDIITWKARLYDENGIPGEWSQEESFEYGLLTADDWDAIWICGIGTDKEERLPADYYRKEFHIEKSVRKARLYATACGIYEAWMNGKRVEGYVLAPGCTQYDKRLYYQTYDVTHMLSSDNDIVFVVGDGWYKGKLGCDGEEYLFGKQTKLFAQLEITYEDGTLERIATNQTFRWSGDGPVRENDLKDGLYYDARKQLSFGAYAEETTYPVLPAASNAPAIREHERFRPSLYRSPGGAQILDFGQNLAGYVAFHVKGRQGQQIRITMGETLDNGEFTTENFTTLPERGKSINQMIEMVLSGQEDVLIPNFFYSGFRYALVEGIEQVKPEDFEAIAVYSDIKFTGNFFCSNEKINRFVNCTIWSEKSNFVDIPTDCPQREKGGWTGDAQVFVKTATYLADTAAFFRKWMKDVYDCQREDGRVDNVAPKVESVGTADAMNGSTGWADAAVIIPYTLWKMYGDSGFITDNYELMHRWKDYVINQAADKSMYQWSKEHPLYQFCEKEKLLPSPYNKYVVEAGLHWGEWAEPEGVVKGDSMMELLRPKPEENAAYMHYSMRLLEEMLYAVGKEEEAQTCSEYSEGAKKAYNLHFVKNGEIISERQAKLVRPIALGLLDQNTQKKVAKKLNDEVVKRDYKIGTGFLSTPFILPVLTENGYSDTAYRMLENTKEPGWLAMVEQGATTVWEHYNGYDENGHPLKSSYNHYSPGAVCSFLFSHTAGIQVMGENRFLIQPIPGGTLTYAKASWNSPYGYVDSSWKIEDRKGTLRFTIPGNCTANLVLPDGQEMEVGAGEHYCEWEEL